MLSLTFTSNKPLTSNNIQPQNIFIQINPGGLFMKIRYFLLIYCILNSSQTGIMACWSHHPTLDILGWSESGTNFENWYMLLFKTGIYHFLKIAKILTSLSNFMSGFFTKSSTSAQFVILCFAFWQSYFIKSFYASLQQYVNLYVFFC